VVILRILLFILMLGILVTFHELGHFLVAKRFDVYCFEFSIGFGPKIYRKRKGETYYSVRAFPLGGYVSMFGEQDGIPKEFENEEIPESRSLLKINRGKRVGIMSAGIVMNLVLGLLIFFMANTFVKQTQLLTSLVITETSKAQTVYNLEDNDAIEFEFVQIGKDEIQHFGIGTLSTIPDKEYYVMFFPRSYADLDFSGNAIRLVDVTTKELTQASFEENITKTSVLTFDAKFSRYIEGQEEPTILTKTLQIETVLKDETNPGKGYTFESIGLSFSKREYFNTPKVALQKTFSDFGFSFTAIGRGIGSLFQKGGFKNLSGFVGIYNQTSDTLTNFGIGQYLFFWGLISVNLAVFNLLPFPGLDGWHILISIIEAIIRREVNPKFKQVASAIGLILLFGLMIAVTIKDIFYITLLL
jgi:regulator of sigma E protease